MHHPLADVLHRHGCLGCLGNDWGHETTSGTVDETTRLEKEAGESAEIDGTDDLVVMQTTTSNKRSRLEYSTTTLLLEALGGALQSLTPVHQRIAADLMLQLLLEYDAAIQEVALFQQLFRAHAGDAR